MKNSISVHAAITNHIVEAMEKSQGVQLPWIQSNGLPTNAITDQAYNGINILNLWVSASKNGYTSNQWATYKQWQSAGAQVRKGQKGSLVVFYKPLTPNDGDDANDDTNTQLSFPFVLKTSSVFSKDQLVSPPKGQENLLINATDKIENADQFVQNTGAKIIIGGDRAYYSPARDEIVLPDRDRFTGTSTSSATESFYSVLLHELTHWTSKEDRCNRATTGRFGTEDYAMEELVAELGSAFLCAELGISNTPRQDHSDYINNWIYVLKDNPKAIFWASSRASEATQYLKEIQDKIPWQ